MASHSFTKTFSCVFLNCHNLFDVGTRRGPHSVNNLTTKIRNLAVTLLLANGMKPPDIIGLCEVASRLLAEQLAEAVAPNVYELTWSRLPPSRNGLDGGLAVLHKRDIVTRSDVVLDPHEPLQRPKWMAVLFQLQEGSRGGFWLLVNHWKSQMGGEADTEARRMTTAQQIGDFDLNQGRIITEYMILIGDFNCQPCDRPFRQQSPNKLKGVRERAEVIRDKNRLAYFYNPMWRWLGEPEDYDATQQAGYSPSRLMGTHLPQRRKEGWYVWDQILVTKPLIVGNLIHLQEGTIEVRRAESQCSDHCVLSAEFQY